ncbi:MAG: EAL domain-containing protein [Rhodospirillales bacterium]|nr:EAL domain-containing protein [Rhodospirillales bacterium]
MYGTEISAQDIEAALHEGELCFYYQPKVSFLNGSIVGGEALLRWIKPDGSIIPPGDFLPLAESSGLISDITAVMLTELIADIEAIKAVKADIQVAYNVAASDLNSPYLVKILRSVIGSRRIGSGNIQIEITETAVLDNSDRIQRSLLDLVALGIEIVMDDFGTGYSSLDLLSRVPFSALKIDQGVVGRMATDAKNTHIVTSSLDMAREMSLKTVAEGIETEATYAFLMAAGCNEAQGFWMSEPLPRDDFISLLESKPQWPSSSLGLLYSAWISHMSYRRKVLDTVHIMTQTSPEDWENLPKMNLVHSPAHCRLSEWHLVKGSSGDDTSDFRKLDDPHRLMHAAGESLIHTTKTSQSTEEITKGIRIFLEYSDRVDAEVSKIVERWLGNAIN